MNTRLLLPTLVLTLAAVAPLTAQAERPQPDSSVLVHCEYGHWPTRQQVARRLQLPRVTVGTVQPLAVPTHVFDVESKAGISRLQQFIRRQGRHECAQGASHVQVEFHPQGRRMAVAVLGTPSP